MLDLQDIRLYLLFTKKKYKERRGEFRGCQPSREQQIEMFSLYPDRVQLSLDELDLGEKQQ